MSDTNSDARTRTRRLPAALAALAAILVIAGCGGNDGVPSASAVRATTTVPATPAPTATTPTTTAPNPAGATTTGRQTTDEQPAGSAPKSGQGTTAKDRSGASTPDATKKRVQGTPRRPPTAQPGKGPTKPAGGSDPTDSDPTGGAGPEPTPLAPTAPSSTKPDPPQGSNPPFDCLEEAGLDGPSKRRDYVWGATSDGTLILVDGPYGDTKEAEDSATLQKDVVIAARGGRYVVSAPLTSDKTSTVDAVARCLEDKAKDKDA